MAQVISLDASDGHKYSAYSAEPQQPAKGGIVVVQEIFGVNNHIREVVDGFADAGYHAIAPALFDRNTRDLELKYDEEGIARGRELAFPLGWRDPVLDIQAAADHVASAGKVGVVGYCWGGSLAFLSAAQCDNIHCGVGYYGGQILKILEAFPDLQANPATMLHFGRQDHGIPLGDVDQIKQHFPQIPIHLYDAGHGFNCSQRGSFNQAAATDALERTLQFFSKNLQ